MKNLKKIWIGLVSILMMWGILFISVSELHIKTAIINAIDYLPNQILNILLLIVIFLILLSIFNRLYFSLSFLFVIVVITAISNAVKIYYRDEPILPGDLTLLSSINKILDMLPIQLIIVVLIMVVFMIMFLGIVFRKDKISVFKSYQRLLLLMVGVLILLPFNYIHHQGSIGKHVANIFGNQSIYWSQVTNYQENGPVMGFINNLDIIAMNKPSKYSKSNILRLSQKYKSQANHINQSRKNKISNQTVIYVLSEAFSNSNELPKINIQPDPLADFNQVANKSLSGKMYSSGFGGGTANIEFEALTSMSMNNFNSSMSMPYTLLIPNLNYVPSVTSLFNSKMAIHTYNASMYNRKSVYKKMGLNPFIYEGNNLKYESKLKNSPYIDDASAFKETLLQLDKEPNAQFINLVTMQNHYPYTNNYPDNSFRVSGANNTDTNIELKNYAYGINKTSKSLKYFIEKIDKMQKHITVVFYGDHLPAINDISNKNNPDMYKTEYIIHSNFNQNKDRSEVITPNYFTPELLDVTNSKVTPYYALMTKLMNGVPGIENQRFITSKNEFKNEKLLNKQQKRLLSDYRLIQYDITSGKQYSLHAGFFKLK